MQSNQRASLPDSTGDQLQIGPQGEGNKVPLQSTDNKSQSPLASPSRPEDQSKNNATNDICSLGGERQADQNQAQIEDTNEAAACAVCQSGGELQRCHECHKVFHLACHVPALLKSPCGEWFCSFCRDLLVPEVEYDCESKPEAKTLKKDPDPERGFPQVDKQKCERLLLHLFCSELNLDFKEPVSPSVCANNMLTIKGPMNLFTVKRRLEAKRSLCYQSTAEFVSDVRLILENSAGLREADTVATVANRKLKELFDVHLRIMFPDQTFPEVRLEMPPTAPVDSQASSLDDMCQPAKRQRTCSDSQDAPDCPSGDGGVV